MSRKPAIHQPARVERRIAWAFALLIFFFVPLFFYRPAIDVTLAPKFLLLSVLLLGFLPILLLVAGKWISLHQLFRQWPVMLWLTFVALSLLSLTVAYNPWEGVFDVFREGILLCFLLILFLYFTIDKPLISLRWAFILLALAQALVGFYQYGSHVFGEVDLQKLYEIDGMMAHKNVFSGLMFLTMPMLIYSIYIGGMRERIFSAAGLFLELTMLMLMQTRAQWLAVAGLITLSIFLVLVFPGVRRSLWKEGGRKFAMLVGICLLVSILAAGLITRASLASASAKQTEVVAEGKSITGLGERAASILDNTTQNRKIRLGIWGYTLEMIADYPLMGVGAGNWKILVTQYFEKGYMTTYYHNWRRPHNDFLQVAAEKGLVTLAVYVAFFIVLVIKGLRYLARTDDRQGIILVALALGGLAGYSIDSMFSFPYERLDEGMLMMLYAALIIRAEMSLRQPSTIKVARAKPWIAYAIAGFLFLCLPFGNAWVKGEVATNEAYTFNSMGRWPDAVKAIDRGYSKLSQIDPSNNPLLWFRGKAYMQSGNMEQARRDLETARQQMPGSIIVLTELGVLYGRMGEHEKALEVLRKAHDILPTDGLVLFNMGLAYYRMNRYQDALDCLYQCLTEQEDPMLNGLIREIKEKLFGPQIQVP